MDPIKSFCCDADADSFECTGYYISVYCTPDLGPYPHAAYFMCKDDERYIMASEEWKTETLSISGDQVIAYEVDLHVESHELMLKLEGENFLSYAFDGSLNETT